MFNNTEDNQENPCIASQHIPPVAALPRWGAFKYAATVDIMTNRQKKKQK